MARGTRIFALLFVVVLTGCTLSIGQPEEQALPVFSGAPVVRITAPLPNATYLTGVAVNVQVQVSNAGPEIDHVEVSLDGVPLPRIPQPNPSGAAAFGVTQTFTADEEGAHVIEARAFRPDGAASDPASVTITVVTELPDSATDTPEPTVTGGTPTPTNTIVRTATEVSAALSAAPPTNTGPTPALDAATAAPNATATAVPMASFEGVVNVRRGPHTNFEPPLGTFQPGQSTEIIGLNDDATWLKVRFAGGEGWVFREIVKTEGDVDSLPRESGPPIPTLAPRTNTPVPPAQPTSDPGQPTADPGQPTTPPTTGDGPNLVVVNWEMRVLNEQRPLNDIAVNKQAIAFVRVRNAGNQPSGGFFAVLTIVNTSDSQGKLVEAGAVGGLAPGEEQTVQIGFIENLVPAGTQRTGVVRLDENNQVPESNENDNASSPITYTLAAQ